MQQKNTESSYIFYF